MAGMRIDLHTHSSVSDGTDTPEELVAHAAAAGLDVVGLCDHDTFDGWGSAIEAGTRHGVRVLRGVEISCEHQGASVHLLGLGCRGEDQALLAELGRIRAGRTERVPRMLAKLADAGMPVSTEVLYRYVGDSPSVGRPHLADAMIELGYVGDRQEAFNKWLADDKPIFEPRYSSSLPVAIELVRAAGGVAVVAHPWGRVSRDQLPAEYLAELVTSGQLDGIEVDHQDHDEATRSALRALAGSVGALITGSSDYHGTGKKNHDLGCNTTPAEVLAELDRLIGERRGLL
jgi:3',5'-nucleoside bisphosphate phosphatase